MPKAIFIDEIYTASKSSSSSYDFTSVGVSEKYSKWLDTALERLRAFGTNPTKVLDSSQPLDQKEIEFRQQKAAFEAIPPLLLSPYQGQFVVSRNGEIVDSDLDLVELSRRFFGEHGDVPVYITRVGGEIIEYLDSPIYL